MKRILLTVLSPLVVLCVAVSASSAAPIRVDCGRGGSISATLAGLVQSGNTRGVTIFVTGTCRENIVIGAFDHLVLQASPIATLQDASNGTAPVVRILTSYDVELQNFNINGGSIGVNCALYSYCVLSLDTVQQSNGPGVRFGRSNGYLLNNKIVNNAGQGGIMVEGGSKLLTTSNTISNNVGESGIAVFFGSYLEAQGDTIQNNGIGIRVVNSVVRAIGVTISGNRSDGMRLENGSAADSTDNIITTNSENGVQLAPGSTAVFYGSETGNVITGNVGDGVAVHDLSFSGFYGPNNVSGNLTQPDVACFPQYSATRGAGTVGGTTNCNEPQKDQQRPSPQMEGDGLSDRQ